MGSYAWIPVSHGSIPPTAVVAGRDCDGSTLYAGRAFFEGDLLPAKVSTSQGAALVAYGGAEHTIHNYEVGVCNLIFNFLPSYIQCKRVCKLGKIVSPPTSAESRQLRSLL